METSLETILTTSYKKTMIAYINSHPDSFEEAINLAIGNKQPYSWRAAWLLWSCMENNDQRVIKYVKDIIDCLPSKNDQQQRELFIILQKMKINEAYEPLLFNICIDVWKKINKQASLRYNAFKLLVKIATNNPGLIPEVKLLIEEHYMDSLSDTVKKSIVKMLNKLQ